MDTALAIEQTNLAGIGSDEDKALKAAAAKIDFTWEGAGQKPGLEIWRVENKRTENDNPDFGIKAWPEEKYGQFHRGDSYIVLLTSKDENNGGDALKWDVFFWIGSESSQDEYGVAAYKANELDDLLGGTPMQHREIEGNESDEFVECFPNGITYLEGGIDSGFRKVDQTDNDHITRLYRVHKKPGHHPARCFEVPLKCSSLNDGDAFLLDAGSKIFTWFGSSVSAFERNKSASVAHNLQQNRLGHCECILGVEDDNVEFWGLLGGKGEVKPADNNEVEPSQDESKMYIVSDRTGKVTVKEVELSRDVLSSDKVCLVDAGKNVYIWVGQGSNKDEQEFAMIVVNRFLKALDRDRSTCVTRVNEGLESRCRSFAKVF
eukprot:CCRYP_012339-RA/>CCRYP_012339-RA protein AED:0.04 eAED:0.03 QI:0/0/0/1/1/1/2/0/375